MADALVSVILDQLDLVEQEVGSVVGVKEEIQMLTKNLRAIRDVLEAAERRQVKEPTVKGWLNKLKDVFYDMDNVLDEWNTAILKMKIEGDENLPKTKRKVCYFIPSSCFCYRQVDLHRDIAIEIKKLNKTLDVISIEKDRYKFDLPRGNEELEPQITTDVSTDVSDVFGRDHEKNTIVDMLLSESSQGPTLPTISIEGMGEIEKTTLAQLIYNDDTVKTHFQKRIWVCVSYPIDEIRIAKAILEALQGENPDSNELESPLLSIHNSIEGKKFLLVLDGVWTEDLRRFEQLNKSLMGGSPGSRILVTTRKGTVAKVIGTIDSSQLEQLSNDECWSLFSEVAFFGKSSKECEILKDIGRKIAEKCNGQPFAAKVLGSLLRLKETKEEWESVLYSEVWMLKESERGFSPPLLLSYYELSSTLRRCFSYCAIFPKSYEIEKDRLIKLWMAQGYLRAIDSTDMEMVGEECFEKLAMHSFFHDFKKDSFGTIITCKMHNIVHDFAQFLTKKECSVTEVIGLNRLRLNFNHIKVRHSMFILEGEVSIFAPVEYVKNLRSLIVEYKSLPLTGAIAFEVLDQFTCLRTLDFSMCKNYRSSLKKLPKEIGKLIHLRYLNLAYNSALKELPETICDLCNLQSLTVTHCESLTSLPHGLGKLIKLRHLEIVSSGISFLPKGFERLTSLRTVDISDVRYYREASNMGDLKNIIALVLDFGWGSTEIIQPPPNLEELSILEYRGTRLPNWMMSLTKLRKVQIYEGRNCKLLPPLGKLPSLESLVIEDMSSVERVGIEFLGIQTQVKKNDNNEGPSKKDEAKTSSSLSVIAFPELKQLHFNHLIRWKEWDYGITRRMGEEEEEDITTATTTDIIIMPRLHSLTIKLCPYLKALPDHILQSTSLNELEIYYCSNLRQRYYNERDREGWPKIAHIPNIKIDDEYVQKDGVLVPSR